MIPKDIRPMPDAIGVGFSCGSPMPEDLAKGYRLEQIGRYFNYHVTPERYDWPLTYDKPKWQCFDGFSPNLNKQLHVGHIRNLAIANSLSQLFKPNNSQFVALLGHSLGVLPEALDNLNRWFDLVGYHPEKFSDIEISERAKIKGTPGEGEQAGCEVYAGPLGPVIIRRSDGRPTYAMHDLAFQRIIGPTYYLTGGEQAEHFKSLGLADKHLPMGLVLDPVTGKKMKSRDGTALTAEDALKMVIDRLEKTYDPEGLAWNVLAWNFLHCGRKTDVKFNIDEWTKPESQGLYVTYTFARIGGAIILGAMKKNWKPEVGKFSDEDAKLMGYASYMSYYKQRAIEQLDPSPLANFASDLAKKLGSTYHERRIADGDPSLQYAVNYAYHALGDTIVLLGMTPLTDV